MAKRKKPKLRLAPPPIEPPEHEAHVALYTAPNGSGIPGEECAIVVRALTKPLTPQERDDLIDLVAEYMCEVGFESVTSSGYLCGESKTLWRIEKRQM